MSDLFVDRFIESSLQEADDYKEMVKKCFTTEQVIKHMGSFSQSLGYKINKFYLSVAIQNVEKKLKKAKHLAENSQDIRIRSEHAEQVTVYESVIADMKIENESMDFKMSSRSRS